MTMFSKRERDILTALTAQLEQTVLAIENLAGTTKEQTDSAKQLNRNLHDQREALLHRDATDVRGPSDYGDEIHEAAESAAYGEGDDPKEVGSRARATRRSRSEGPRISMGGAPTGGSADIGGGGFGDGGGFGLPPTDGGAGGFEDEEPEPDDTGAPTPRSRNRPRFTPDQMHLRQRASILNSKRANFARTLWFGNRPTAQQMAWMLSERTARWAFETEPDAENPDERVPIYMPPGVEPARDSRGQLIKNQYNQVVSHADYQALGENPAASEVAELAGAQVGAKAGIPLMRGGGIGMLGNALGGVSRGLSAGASLIPEIAIATAAIQFGRSVMEGVYAPGRAGLQMGYEQSVTGAGSRNFLSGKFDALQAANFGFNPWLSIGSAMEINRQIEGIGYRGDQRDAMVNSFSTLAERGLNVKDFIGMFNNDFRYGATNLSDFVNTMEQIPAAAQAANMNVSAFTQQLTEVSQSIAQRSGTSATNVAGQITAVSQATGMTPALAGTQVNDQFLTIMGASHFGERLGTYLADPRRASYQSTQGVEQKFQLLTGQSLSRLPQDQNLQALVREINYVQPNAFGMDFSQLMQAALDPNRNRATAGNTDLNQIMSGLIPFTNGRIMLPGKNGLTDVTSMEGRDQLNKRISSDLQQAGVSQDQIKDIIAQTGTGTSMGDIQNEIRKASRAVADVTHRREQTANAKTSVIVGLDPTVKGILTTVVKNADYENIQSPNGGNSIWSEVGDFAGSTGSLTENIVGAANPLGLNELKSLGSIF